MTKQQTENMVRLVARLETLGLSYRDTVALLKIERTLSRWAEAECNGVIQRDGDNGDGKPFAVYEVRGNTFGGYNRCPIADREKGALKRLGVIMAPFAGKLIAYHQGDPRGCALYVVELARVPAGSKVDSCYSNGVAVCV